MCLAIGYSKKCGAVLVSTGVPKHNKRADAPTILKMGIFIN